jgi:hypothetical protein
MTTDSQPDSEATESVFSRQESVRLETDGLIDIAFNT